MSSSVCHHINSSNDELINELVQKGFIQAMDIEKVLRSVDRGFYFTNDEKRNAYLDSAWELDKIHLSAPCVYAVVLECLKLRPGDKFLNIGSGIGYLSTVAGLLLGMNGVNHGIEIHKSLIDYALQKIEDFKLNSAAIDYYDFCEPVFIQGNACDLMPIGYYDRVYCGVDVPPTEYEFMKSLINVGGILIMSVNGLLVQISRTKEYLWITKPISRIFNTNLVVPEHFSLNTIKFPPVEPLSLQELCRSTIRSVLRENLKKEFPNLSMSTLCSIISKIKNGNLYRTSDDLFNYIQNIVEFYCSHLGGLFESINLENDVNPNQENSNTEQTSDEPRRRNSPEAGSSMQNNTSTETDTDTENSQAMKINKSPRKSESVTSSFHSDSDSWETESTDTSSFSLLQEDSSSGMSSLDAYVYGNLEPRVCDNCYEYQVTRRMEKFSFINERKENELSKYLKDKIDSLPIPTSLKVFLNYNSIN